MRHIVLALALATAAPVQAGVVYNWQTLDAKGSTDPLIGTLIVTEQAWRSGYVNYEYRPGCMPSGGECDNTDIADPTSPVLLLRFEMAGTHFVYADYRAGRDFADGESSRVAVNFDGASLKGGMDYSSDMYETIPGGGYANMGMHSSGDVWTIVNLYSDRDLGSQETPHCWYSACPGITGRWVLDASTVPVPLPGTLALFALGLALVGRHVSNQAPVTRNIC